MGKGQDIEQISKKKIIKNGKFPGSGFPSWLGPLSRYNALPTELWELAMKGEQI